MRKTTTPKQDPNAVPIAYLFSGEVDARRDHAVDDLIGRMVDPGSTVFDLSEFEGDETNADSIIAAAMTLPLASERKVVVVKHIERLDPSDQCRVAAFLGKLGPTSCIIFLTGEDAKAKPGSKSAKKDEDEDPEEDAPKKRKKGLQSELVKAVKTYGQVVDFGRMRSDDMAALIARSIAALGKKADPSALQSLARSLAANPGSIDKEAEKLATYVGDRDKITMEDVDAVITKSPEERVFPLIDAIAARRPDQAIQLLNETMAASARIDSEVLKIISMLAGHFRRLYQVRFLKAQGVRNFAYAPEELRELLPEDSRMNPLSMQDWQLKKFVEQSAAFSLGEIEECIKHILACELASKGIGKGDGSSRLNLEMLVFKLSQRRRT
jgi:DNA polymerase III subunit delta